jgi:ankyrin repeat protein
VEVVRILLEHGVDATILNKTRLTALHIAAQTRRVEVVSFLLKHGRDATSSEADGVTPLHRAAEEGYTTFSSARRMLGPTAHADDGRAPLPVAAKKGHGELSRLLVR